MEIIPFKKSYYKEVSEWWAEHGWTPVHEDMLSFDGYVVVDENGEKILCGWLVKTNGMTALLEWIISNPKFTGKKVYKSLSILEKHIYLLARNLGYRKIIIMLEHSGLIKFFNKNNWNIGDKNLSILIKEVV